MKFIWRSRAEIWVHPFGTVTSLVHVSSSSGKNNLPRLYKKQKLKISHHDFSSAAFCGFLDSRKKQNWTEKEELFSTQTKPGHTIFSLESLPIYSINLQHTAPRPPLSRAHSMGAHRRRGGAGLAAWLGLPAPAFRLSALDICGTKATVMLHLHEPEHRRGNKPK